MFKRSQALDAVTVSFSSECGGNLFTVNASLGQPSHVPKHRHIGPVGRRDAILREFSIPILNYLLRTREYDLLIRK